MTGQMLGGHKKSGRRRVGTFDGLGARALDYRDEAALTTRSADGKEPGSRELSGAWLAGTVLTGLTSVLLMGAALYVSFSDIEGYSTAYKSLEVERDVPPAAADGKTSRARPVLETRSDREVVSASVMASDGASEVIRNASFVRVSATLATSQTALTDDVVAYSPENYIEALPDDAFSEVAIQISTDVLGAPAAEVSISYAALPSGYVPRRAISDAIAAAYVGATSWGDYSEPGVAMAYFGSDATARASAPLAGMAENVTVVPKTTMAGDSRATSERIVKLDVAGPLLDTLVTHGFTPGSAAEVQEMIRNLYRLSTLEAGSRLRILLGPSGNGGGLVPYRLSIYLHDDASNSDRHAVTVALTDTGRYVVALAPPDIPFSEESTEQIDVANLPSIYQSIWETGRRNDVADEVISQIVALVAYDTDLTRRVQPGDGIELLTAAPGDGASEQLLYAAISLGNAKRRFYRYAGPDGTVAFFDEQGESGKRFLLRRPLEGGGRLTSAMGTRIDPFNGGNANHEGTDFAAPRGTPIYAAADGVVDMAQWYSGYGRYVQIKHLNGYQTAYAHMNAIADGITPGVRVRQGQVIGYVGSTGRSTGNHLHFELEINGRIADPLEIKLPRAKTLPPQYMEDLRRTMEQVRSIMDMPAGGSTHA
ncbi:MAG: M23 family metallopeptidase [Devosia sp.]|jgi:murein DD-endopeptidase MepM/ murein hydrolase activator NlpD|uniref:M23 family metallopeptidase n=1 Tax=Devosia sp. TaxID=1871048 RepID=UPI0024CC7B03|nr:M23 family metallopeptidase [Devosia sp.]UYO00876.1 MAG: M23 family metallopeptidase [Devosia sp.]